LNLDYEGDQGGRITDVLQASQRLSAPCREQVG